LYLRHHLFSSKHCFANVVSKLSLGLFMQSSFFPSLEPFAIHSLCVSSLHTLYIEECGNPQGPPLLFLHGGPGAGLSASHRRFFDPSYYRIILFDQRGCGKSTPYACLEENTTWDLVADIEKIRLHLGVDRWIVFGGSWGSTLALIYAQCHSERVKGLILRGIFLGRAEEIGWFYQEGAHWFQPQEWERYLQLIPANERGDLVGAYYRRLTSSDPLLRQRAADSWSRWEGACLKLQLDEALLASFTEKHKALALARIESHYFVNEIFLKDRPLLAHTKALRSIPSIIIHGRYDLVCPVKNAFDLKAAWPEAQLEIIPDAGHAADEKGTLAALIRATEAFKTL
jgi:proline iminopeptidase